jgi:mannose-1-phosphate guanylyltransferase
VLAEPVGRNTAPCLGFAAIKVLKEVGDVPMLCLPADHLILNEDEVRRTYQAALNCAREQDVLVTIGIRPSAPETGYGYIHQGEIAGADERTSMALMHVKEFVEKPDRATAEQYLKSGAYFWNSGTFAWRPSVLLRAINQYLPDLGASLERIGECFGKADEFDLVAKEFESITKISVDYGVMEQAQNVLMVPGSGFEWNDVGSWSAWADCAEEAQVDLESPSNIAYNPGETVFVDAKHSAVYGEGRAVAVVGLEDVIVVETKDAVLVCHRDRTQEVKDVVEYLDSKGRKDLL